MKKETRKLTLSRETIVQLTAKDLARAAGGTTGGGWSEQSVCPSANISECRSCG